MAIGVILGIIIAALFIGACAMGFIGADNDNGGMCVAGLIGAFVLLIAFIIVPFSFHTVQTGQVAVVKHLGKATHVRSAGTYFDLWITDKYQKYDGKVQNTTVDLAAYSSDAQTMVVQTTVQYQIRTDKAMDIANQYGKIDALDARLMAVATEKTKSVLSSYKAMDIIANRASMSPAVEEIVREAVGDDYYVDIISVVLTNIDFSDAFETAVEEKMIAEQKQLKAAYENETKLATAKAEAEAKIVAAEADKKANDLLVLSLSDEILQKLWIEKWDGKMPEYYGGDADLMINTGK